MDIVLVLTGREFRYRESPGPRVRLLGAVPLLLPGRGECQEDEEVGEDRPWYTFYSRLGVPHPIATVPPNYLSRQPVHIKFNQLTLQHFELNEFLKDIAIHGYMEVNWMDDRLVWSTDTWKMEKLHIQSLNHIWFPIFIAQK